MIPFDCGATVSSEVDFEVSSKIIKEFKKSHKYTLMQL